MRKRLASQSGLSLIEVALAIGLFAIFASAIVAILATMIAVNNASIFRTKATRYMEQGLEQVQDFYQTQGFQALYNKVSSPGPQYTNGTLCCAVSVPWTRTPLDNGNFTSLVILSSPTAYEVCADSEVSYTGYAGGPYGTTQLVRASRCFFNY